MKRLINSTTILSMALYTVTPFAAQAQDFPKAMVDGQEVICLPDKKTECPEGAFCVVVKNPKNCEARAIEAVAASIAEAAAAQQAVTDQAAADQAAAEKATADAAAAADAAVNQAAVDAAAAEAAAAEAVAAAASAADKAAADQAAADAAAAEQAAKDQAAADQAAADKAARRAEKKAADEAAAAEAAAAEAAAAAAAEAQAAEAAATDAAELPAVEATAPEATVPEATVPEVTLPELVPEATAPEVTTEEAVTAEATTAEAVTAFPTVTVEGQVFICLPDKDAVCPDGAVCVIGKTEAKCIERATAKLAKMTAPEASPVTEAPAEDAAAVAAAQAAAEAAAAAAAADPNVETVDVPEPTEEAIETLETALETPVEGDVSPEPNVDADLGVTVTPEGTLPADTDPSDEATVTTEVVTEEDARDSTEEFAPVPTTVAPGKKTGLSDFEKVGLLALGALAIGAMINGNKQVVSNTGDRVVVRQPDGTYQVYKDDNALLREPGSTVRTETFRDGSTRTIVQRADGSQVVTIRDATGRVLQRVAYDRNGRGTVLIDDLQPEERVDVSALPKPKPGRNQISVDDLDLDLRAQLAADDAAEIGRKFSLRQIRNIPEVRYLAATIDVNNITFESGSSAILPTEAKKLNKLGNLITRLIEANPNEVFLIEGHTDAVGSAASNLALSDRRAESVAKALTEYFGVPPENLVVQGYGEAELKIETQGDERANRRVAVRIITNLLRQNAN